MREIKPDEVYKLRDCLSALAEHHNRVSDNFKGGYPRYPFEHTLKLFEEALQNQTSRIAVIEDNSDFVGFCKIDADSLYGKLDYLIVLPAFRGKGYGSALMDWAMKSFSEMNIHNIDVKVVAGNDTIRLYEKYGFQMNAYILKNIN